MDIDFKDLIEESTQTNVEAHSILFFQSHRHGQHLSSGPEDDLTPWSDHMIPTSLIQSQTFKQIVEKKKSNASELGTAFRTARKREKLPVFQSTGKLLTEYSRELEPLEDTTATTSNQNLLRSPGHSLRESPKTRNVLNLVFKAQKKDKDSSPPIRPQNHFLGGNIAKRISPVPQYVPSTSFPALTADLRRGLVIQKQLATRSDKFWLSQSKISPIGSEEVSMKEPDYPLTNKGIKIEDNRSEVIMPHLETHRQPLLNRTSSKKKETFETKALSGTKTELNDFKKKLSAFGLYNFEKKTKMLEEKIAKHKSDSSSPEPKNTDLKLKLEILRKMTSKDSHETPKSRNKGDKTEKHKHIRHLMAPSYSGDRGNLVAEYSLFNTEQTPEPPKTVGDTVNTAASLGSERNLIVIDYGIRFQSDGDIQKTMMDKLEQNKSFDNIKEKSQDQSTNETGSQNLKLRRNLSQDRSLKSHESRKLLQVYIPAEVKLTNLPEESIKSPSHPVKGTANQQMTQRKWNRNRKYTKCSTNYNELLALKDVLKIGGIEKN